MIKNVFSELEGTNWAKIASGNISSQALNACLVESQFERCATQQTLVSGQRFCSKSTGSATDVVATDPVAVWFRQDKKSTTTFFKPDKYSRCTLNSELNAKWHCCLDDVAQMGVKQILKQAKWRYNCSFWDVRSHDRNLVITLAKINF
jgi:hypothetical protein